MVHQPQSCHLWWWLHWRCGVLQRSACEHALRLARGDAQAAFCGDLNGASIKSSVISSLAQHIPKLPQHSISRRWDVTKIQWGQAAWNSSLFSPQSGKLFFPNPAYKMQAPSLAASLLKQLLIPFWRREGSIKSNLQERGHWTETTHDLGQR